MAAVMLWKNSGTEIVLGSTKLSIEAMQAAEAVMDRELAPYNLKTVDVLNIYDAFWSTRLKVKEANEAAG
jgi:hypothetical protein